MPAAREDPQSYGAGFHKAKENARYARLQRQRMNYVSVVQAMFFPWFVFCLVAGVTAFDIHYSKPWMCWTIVAIFGLLVVKMCCSCYPIIQAKSQPHANTEPSWTIFVTATTFIAVVTGAYLGNVIFWTFMQQYYDYENLNNYENVDVSRMKSPQVMDGGTITFVKETVLDNRWAMGFTNFHTYCVAPLTMMNLTTKVKNQLHSYDFWAVGKNCCTGNSDTTDFRCGEWDNINSKGGLRLLEDEDRAFYRLAVQQAEGLYHIKANHPMFVYWTEDPKGEMNSWKQEGHALYYVAMMVHFFWQGLVTTMAVIGFAKMGHY